MIKCEDKFMKDVLILTRMYVGRYLEDNIGHEVINLFRDDEGRNYIYVNHDGTINPKYNDRVKAILLVKHVEKGVLEVIAKAEELEQVLYKSGNIEIDSKNQIEYIKNNKIRYGGAYVYEIHKNTIGEKITVTFRSEKLRKPKKTLYLIEDDELTKSYENYCLLPEKHFSNQSLKMYYEKQLFPKDFTAMESLLDNSDLWEEENTTQKLDIYDTSSLAYKSNFLSIIRKQDDELVFSNLLAHFFEENRKMFVEFCKDVLGIDGFETDFKVTRESSENIDLCIEDSKSMVIIENKIKSKINGERHDIYSDGVQSQLNKYYEWASRNCEGRNVHCYILSPDYNHINLEKYASGDKYTIIHYSDVYEFYKNHAGEMIHSKYFTEFLDGLHMHSSTIDNSNFETMKQRFIDSIIDITSKG